jgi:hypothetical protein
MKVEAKAILNRRLVHTLMRKFAEAGIDLTAAAV